MSNTDETRSSKHLVFLLGNQRFAIPLKHVKEVIAIPKMTPMPRSQNFLKGLINVRGRIIQVLDLFERLHLPKPAHAAVRPSIIISEISDLVVGAAVDEVLEVRLISESELGEPSDMDGPVGKEHISAIARSAGEPMTQILNLERVLRVKVA